MMKWVALSALAFVGACATQAPYGPASRDGGAGYSVQPIENNRFRITYTDTSAELARSRALRRAAELSGTPVTVIGEAVPGDELSPVEPAVEYAFGSTFEQAI